MNAPTTIDPNNAEAAIIDDMRRGTPRQIRRWVKQCVEVGLVPFVQSSPGMGKSDIMRSIADEYSLQLIDHRISTSAPEDFNGLPRFNENGTAHFAPFEQLFPLEGITPIPDGKDGWFLFFDEVNHGTKSVMAAMYKPVLDKVVGQYPLHSRVRMAMAGNLGTDRAFANQLSTAMQSRLIHLEMKADYKEWEEDFAIPKGIDERIIAYLNYKPGAFHDFKPDHKNKTFCCPRTWEFMHKHINGQQVYDIDIPLYCGTITEGVAVDFVQFTKVWSSMIQIEDVARDWDGIVAPRDVATKYAVVSHLAAKVTEKTIEPVMKFISKQGNFDASFKILFYRLFTMGNPKLATHPMFTKAMVELDQLLRR